MKKIFLSVAILGIAAVATAQQTTTAKKFDNEKTQQQWQARQQENLNEMKTQLNLSDLQVAEIKAMQDKKLAEKTAQAEQNREAMKQRAEQAKKNRDTYQADFQKILTPEQYAKWQTIQKEKSEQRKAAMQNQSADKQIRSKNFRNGNFQKGDSLKFRREKTSK